MTTFLQPLPTRHPEERPKGVSRRTQSTYCNSPAELTEVNTRSHTTPWPWRPELGELLRLAGPVIAARLGIMVMGLTDAIVVGRYSAEQLAELVGITAAQD